MKFNYITVKFKNNNYDDKEVYSGKEYEFINFEENLKVNDKVVVECATGLQIAKVTKTNIDSSIADKYVICKIDTNSILEKVKQYVEYKTLLDKIDERYNTLSKIEMYRKMAETDKSLKEMLDKLDNINKGE